MAGLLLEEGLSADDFDQLEASTSQVPPFLFRAFSVERSRGVNHDYEMRPVRERSFPRRSLFARSKAEIKPMLKAHLLWKYHIDSDFISWSSSILWVLEHAARMHSYECKSNVHIAVMDTRKIDDMALFPATTLMEVFGVPEPGEPKSRERDKLQQAYYTSEYLFYGPLHSTAADPCYKAVPWEQICGADLHKFLGAFPGRPSNDFRLLLRIAELRSSIEIKANAAKLQDTVPMMVLIGTLFGKEFQCVVTIALATLLCGGQNSDAAELRHILKNLPTLEPRESKSITQFDFASHIDADLTEVVRMHRTLTDMLALGSAPQHELIGAMGGLNIDR